MRCSSLLMNAAFLCQCSPAGLLEGELIEMFDNTACLFGELKKMAALGLAAALMLSAVVSCTPKNDASGKNNTSSLSEKDEQSLDAFLVRFIKGYPVSSDGKWEYDCSAPLKSDTNILACIVHPTACDDWTLYSDIPEEECFIEKSDDPRGWAKETYSYNMYDAETVEFIAREIFHLSENDMQVLTQLGESKHLFYKESGKYYTVSEGMNDAFADIRLISVEEEGGRYLVQFDANFLQKTDNSDEYISVSGKCRAEMGLKNVGGRQYWSLYHFNNVD